MQAPPTRLSPTRDSLGPSVKEESSLGKRLGLMALGAISLSGIAGTAAAQEAPDPPPESSVSLTLQDPPARSSDWRFSVSHTNDSLNLFPGVARGDDRSPDGIPDDDGWTAGMRFDFTKTDGNEQWVGALRYDMLTQQGAWEHAEDYQGFRTDIAEIGLQKNFRQELSERTDLYYGIGGGLQLHGELGGEYFQLKTHELVGGRLEPELQNTYTTNGVSFAPVVTGGVGVRHELNSTGSLAMKSSLEGSVALGPGLSTLRASTGLIAQPHERISLEGGVLLGAAHANARSMDFYDIDGVRPGAYGQVDFKVSEGFNVFGRLESGGVRDEPYYMIGISIGLGGGSKPWLHPQW